MWVDCSTYQAGCWDSDTNPLPETCTSAALADACSTLEQHLALCLYQSINPSLTHSINQSTNQSINRIGEFTTRAVSLPGISTFDCVFTYQGCLPGAGSIAPRDGVHSSESPGRRGRLSLLLVRELCGSHTNAAGSMASADDGKLKAPPKWLLQQRSSPQSAR